MPDFQIQKVLQIFDYDQNCEYFACYFHENKNYCLDKFLLFLEDLKFAMLHQFIKRNPNLLKRIIGQ